VTRRQGRASIAAKLVMAALCLLWVIPTAGIVITSLRTPDAVNSSGWWTVLRLPLEFGQLSAASYRQALNGGMAASFLNSLAVTLPAVAIPVVIAGMAAYAFTFLEFPGRDLLFGLIVGLLIVPNQVALAPLLRIYGDLGLTGTYAAVYLTHIGFGMPLAVFIFRGFMRTLPVSVIESAKVDGASHYQIFWRLVVPLSVPALAAFAIFQFLLVWNDLLIGRPGAGVRDPAALLRPGPGRRVGQRVSRWRGSLCSSRSPAAPTSPGDAVAAGRSGCC
jgi:alpha-glucoside transport system permease protein